MNINKPKPLILRLLSSRPLWTFLIVAMICAALYFGSNNLSGNLLDNQGQLVADNVRRSAVQCYAIEGRFPTTADGVAYLEKNYGLAIDHQRYVVYYESLGDNLIPQIQVIVITPQSPTDLIGQTLGLGNGGD